MKAVMDDDDFDTPSQHKERYTRSDPGKERGCHCGEWVCVLCECNGCVCCVSVTGVCVV